MDVPAVHPSRGTVGTAHGAGAVRSNELLDDGAHIIRTVLSLSTQYRSSRGRQTVPTAAPSAVEKHRLRAL